MEFEESATVLFALREIDRGQDDVVTTVQPQADRGIGPNEFRHVGREEPSPLVTSCGLVSRGECAGNGNLSHQGKLTGVWRNDTVDLASHNAARSTPRHWRTPLHDPADCFGVDLLRVDAATSVRQYSTGGSG